MVPSFHLQLIDYIQRNQRQERNRTPFRFRAMVANTKHTNINDMESGIVPRESSYGSLGHSEHIQLDSSNPSSKHNGLSMHVIENSNTHLESTINSVESTSRQQVIGSSQHPSHYEHLQKTRQYYRDMMLGVNDGLVSTLLLVAGVVGGGMDVTAVLLTAVSGAIAGAISMFAGEFVATKSQNEVMRGEIKLEQGHIANYHSEEMQELSNLLALIGIPASSPNLNDLSQSSQEPAISSNSKDLSQTSQEDIQELRRLIKKHYAANSDALLKIMVALELGVIDDEIRSPFVAGGTSFGCFFLGALPSTVPFACVSNSYHGLLAAGIATCIGLCIVGAVKSWATRGNFIVSALENLSITVAGGGIAYGIGVGFQNLIGESGL